MMNGKHKLTPRHLCRRAVVYLRQSSYAQVKNNIESQDLQYAMVGQARDLGFDNIEVVDCDLGSSAAMGSKKRAGFEGVLGAIASGQVGLVVSREISRLLRTDKDFCQLAEVCQAFDTLLADAESIYDISSMEDQLVVGLKGTLSVIELKTLKLRLQQGKDNKAKRGELYPLLPPGYVWDGMGRAAKNPDQRVQDAIALVFEKFREEGSIRQTFKWFHNRRLELPVGKSRGGKWTTTFQVPRLPFISYILHNPFYAGAYVWGRHTSEMEYRDGVLLKQTSRRRPIEQAKVFLPDHHEAYITWAIFQENQQMIARNDTKKGRDEALGAVRKGKGLLSGILRCGHCGRKLMVRYYGKSGTIPRYLCGGDFLSGGDRYCLGFGGSTVDKRFSEEILRVISPLGVQASICALEQLDSQHDALHSSLKNQLKQLEYESARAFEQYNEVDPRNRLVASELERRWNAKLNATAECRTRIEDLEAQRREISSEEKPVVTRLGEQFPSVWSHPACSGVLKKKIIRAVVEEVIVSEAVADILTFVVHWKGGCHTSFKMDKPSSYKTSATTLKDLEIITKMAPRYGDDVIALVLNKLERRTGKGNIWNSSRVKTARSNHSIAGRHRSVEDPDIFSQQGAARYTKTSDTTIKRLVDCGLLPMRQIVPFAPWEIQRADLENEKIQSILQELKQTGRLNLGGTSGEQRELF